MGLITKLVLWKDSYYKTKTPKNGSQFLKVQLIELRISATQNLLPLNKSGYLRMNYQQQ
jgi:hypothetical protein